MIDPDKGEKETLIAHFARANTHWEKIDNSINSLVVFQGPHCYVSPTWYEEEITVPTWNYATVHAYGKLKFFKELEELRPMLESLVAKYEEQQVAFIMARNLKEKGI